MSETKDANAIAQKRRDLGALLKELEAGQKEMEAGPLAESRGAELSAKAKEAQKLQDEIDAYDGVKSIIHRGRQLENEPVLPTGENNTGERKSVLTTAGRLFANSPGYKAWLSGKAQSGFSQAVKVNGLGLIRLHGKAADEVREIQKKAFDAADISDLGTEAIVLPDRDPEVVRFEERKELTMRDVLRVLPTSSDIVRYARIKAFRKAAATVAKTGVKPYAKLDFEKADTPVITIAVLHKVTEQDIEDAPRLMDIIDGELRYDVRLEEERQIVWGQGTTADPDELSGIFNDPTVTEFDRAEVGDTPVDLIRRMRTDVRLARLRPDSVWIHPIDWEDVELQKGTDDRYVWAIVQTAAGPRIWSMGVLETEAMENPDTGERRLVVADAQRGATLYDRHDVRLAVGYANDDFERNLRTMRVEERVALAVKRGAAFKYAVMAEASS